MSRAVRRPAAALGLNLALALALGCGGADLTQGSGRSISVAVSPKSVILQPGGSVAFSAVVIGNRDQSVTWQTVGGASNGSFTAKTGIYTAPSIPGTYTIVGSSTADPTQGDQATIIVPEPLSVAVAPADITLAPGGTQLFTAAVGGISGAPVTWKVLTTNGGAFTGSTGFYTAPVNSGTYVVAAVPKADETRIGTATVRVAGPVSVTVSPSAVNLLPGGTQAFTATVTGSANTAVAWSVLEAGGGSIDRSSGLYTAPGVPGAFTVRAVSQADPTASATARVVVNSVSLSIAPTSVVLDQGATQIFVPTLNGASSPSIAWSLDGGTALTQSSPYLFTAPASAGTHVLAASPVVAPSVIALATIQVNPVVITAINPAGAVLTPGATLTFSATVTGSVNKAVTWSASGAGGSIDSSGVYVAPSTAGTDFITARASANSQVTRTAVVTVGSVTISPSTGLTVPATTGRISFAATVTGVSDPGVFWSILPTANGGAISEVGYFMAPTLPGVYRVRATSTVNPALFGEVKVTVQ